MKSMLAAAVLCVALLTATACGQCSSTANLISIAAMNGNNLVVDQVLDNDIAFIFYADETGTKILFYMDADGGHLTEEFTEDENGAIVMETGDVMCTVECASTAEGGVFITLEPGVGSAKVWPAASIEVTAAGIATNKSAPVGCSCGGSGTRNSMVCTPGACRNGYICKTTGATATGWCGAVAN